VESTQSSDDATAGSIEDAAAEPQPIRAAGMGCFHFELQRGSTVSDVETYQKAVVDALERLPSVTNVETSCGGLGIRAWEVPPIDDWPDLAVGDLYPPLFQTQLTFRFEVQIPERVQRELAGPMTAFPIGERFRVTMLYGFHGPAALVEALDGIPAAASQGVFYVRQFLRRELETRGAPVSLGCLGPSPMHVDLTFRTLGAGTPGNRKLLRRTREAQMGYDAIYVDFEGDENDMPFLAQELCEDAAAVYFVVAQERLVRAKATEAEDAVTPVAELLRGRGFRNWLRRTFRAAAAQTSAVVAVTEYEMLEAAEHSAAGDLLSKIETDAVPSCFLKDVQEIVAQSDRGRAPTTQWLRLLDLAETRRSKRVDVAAVALSSLLGGVVGAALTAVFT